MTMRVAGEIYIGEAGRWAAKAYRPLSGAPWPMIVGNIVSVVTALAGIMSYAVLNRLGAPDWGWLPWIVGAGILSFFTGPWAWRRLSTRIFRERLLERNTANPLSTAIEITPEALISRSEAVETYIAWSGVSEVNLVGPYWVVMAQASPIFLPRRFFADETTEQAFITALLDHMTPAARARSRTTIPASAAAATRNRTSQGRS